MLSTELIDDRGFVDRTGDGKRPSILHTHCAYTKTTDNRQSAVTTPGHDGAVNNRRRSSPVDHTRRPVLCTARRMNGRDGVKRSVGVSQLVVAGVRRRESGVEHTHNTKLLYELNKGGPHGEHGAPACQGS